MCTCTSPGSSSPHPAILSDLGVVVLVGVLAGAAGERAALRRFQYACSPLPS